MNPELQQMIALWNKLSVADKYTFQKNLQIFDGHNIITGTNTGTQIATAITQKVAFYGLTPVVQPSSTGETTGASDVNVTNATTFNGNNGATAYTILDVVKHLKNMGILKK